MELVFEIIILFILFSIIFSIIVSLSSVPILNSSSNMLSFLCKNLPLKYSLDTSISFNPSLCNFLAWRKLVYCPDLIITLLDFASITSSEKFFDL